MNRFTVEETNLISIYIADTRRGLSGEMTGALPYMDGEMRELALRTLANSAPQSGRLLPFSPYLPLTKYGRAETADDATTEPQRTPAYPENLLQLYGQELHFAGRWGRVRLSAAHFLFASLQMVSKRRTSRRQAALRGTLPSRGQAAVRRVQRGVCVHLKQRQILPGLPQSGSPAGKPPRGCGNDAPALRSRREKSPCTMPRPQAAISE